ncbi:MAG TPA: hypothetical protein VF242_10015 [Nitrososphaeraceae archaeon]|jgi:hypothetical protein|nr:hypothetical protein [Nitrososphaeraceae archaeon]
MDQNNHNSNRAKIMIVTELEVNENTFKRFDTLLIDLMEKRKKNMDYDDLLNELIDNYQQNNWDQFMVAGG